MNFARKARRRRAALALATITSSGTALAVPAIAHAAAAPGLIAYVQSSVLYVADADGSDARAVPNVPLGADSPTWTPDGSAIVFRDKSAEMSVRPDGTGLAVLVANAPTSAVPLVDPQGKYVLYTGADGNLAAAWADGSAPLGPVDTGVTAPFATVDPANGQLVVEGSSDGEIQAVGADGTKTSLAEITGLLRGDRDLAISPDGTQLAYLAAAGGTTGYQPYVVGLDYAGSGTSAVLTGATGTARELGTGGSTSCGAVAWSADGADVLSTCGGTLASYPAAGGDPTSLGIAGASPAAQPAASGGSAAPLRLNAVANLSAPPAPALPTPGPVQAATNGQVLGVQQIGTVTLGTALRPLSIEISVYDEVWAPDGSALYLLCAGGLYRTGPNGTDPQRLISWPITSAGSPYRKLAIDASGRDLILGSPNGDVYSFPVDAPPDATPTLIGDGAPLGRATSGLAVSPLNNSVIADESGLLVVFTPTGRVYQIGTAAASSTVSISPDGTEVVVGSATATKSSTVYSITNSTADASGVVTGLGAQPLLTIAAAQNVHWSPDGATLDYIDTAQQTWTQVPAAGGTPTMVAYVPGITQVLLQPVRTDTPGPQNMHVVRIWGSTAIGTAIAASQYAYDGYTTATGSRLAQAVVIGRSDEYYDALAGSALAVAKNAPLLLNPSTGLDPAVSAEISRVLKPGGTVYVLGGDSAMSPAIDRQLITLGYIPQRLAGSDMYGTAVAIARAITATPKQVVVATGTTYQDALSSVSLAQQPGTVLVLSDGTTLPAPTQAYLGQLAANTEIEGIGGPAMAAVNQWGSSRPGTPYTGIVGSNAAQTSTLVAQAAAAARAYAGLPPRRVAIATDDSWYDGLAGGAAIVHADGDLVLTGTSALSTGILQFNAANGVGEADILGGTVALPAALQAPTGADLTEGVGTSDYTSFTPGSILPPFAN